MLNRLLGRRPVVPPAAGNAIASLARLGEARADLQQLAATLAALIEAMYAHDPPLPRIDLEPAHLTTKLAGGVPALRGERVEVDRTWVRTQFIRLCRVMEAHGNQFAPALARAATADAFPVGELAVETISGDPRLAAGRAAGLDLDAGLAATLIRLTLFPMLERLQGEIAPRFAGVRWRRGYCPVCGSWPLLGEYRGLELARFLRCGLCAAEWEIDRLVCPICDNRVPQDLVNLSVEGEEMERRAVACRHCHSYVKQISRLAPLPGPALLVADLETLDLDLIAHERGYLAPS